MKKHAFSLEVFKSKFMMYLTRYTYPVCRVMSVPYE